MEFNLFKKREQITTNVKENKEKDFSQSLKDLQELLRIKGGEISPNDIEKVSGLKLTELLEFLGKENFNLKVNSQDLYKSIKDSIDDSPAKESWWRRFSNKTATRATFAALMIILKFAPEVKGAQKIEIDDKEKEKTENAIKFKTEPEDKENTYQVSVEELDALEIESSFLDLEDHARLELTNYFETDKANISEGDKQIINDKFKLFLDNINTSNFEQIMETDFVIFGSSDPRVTNNWGGSNEKLTEARISEAENILQEILNNYDFDNRLSDDQKEAIKKKGFKYDMPDNGPEKGVTYLTDLKNKETEENYTEAEIKEIEENNPDLYFELLKQCRQVSVDFLAPKINDEVEKIPPLEPSPEREIEREILTKWGNYRNVSFIVDNSPSMNHTYSHIAEVIASQDKLPDTEIKFATFSYELDEMKKLENSQEAINFINEMVKDGNTYERAVHSAISALEKMPKVEKNEKNLLLIATDEPLQSVDLSVLQTLKELAVEKNCEVNFLYAHSRYNNKTARVINIEELEEAYHQLAWRRLGPQVERLLNLNENRLDVSQRTFDRTHEMMNRLLDRGAEITGEQQERVIALRDRNNNLEAQMVESQRLVDILKPIHESQDIAKLLSNENLSQLLEERNLERLTRVNIDGSNIGREINLDENDN